MEEQRESVNSYDAYRKIIVKRLGRELSMSEGIIVVCCWVNYVAIVDCIWTILTSELVETAIHDKDRLSG